MLRLCSTALLLIVLAGAVCADDAAPEAREASPVSEAILQTKVDLSVNQASLDDVLRTLASAAEVNIVVDARGTTEAGIEVDKTSTTLLLKGVPLQDALDTILKPHGLAWHFEDEVFKVTSPVRAKGEFVTAVYPVGDLVATQAGPSGGVQVDRAMLNQLGEFLKTSVEPDSWTDAGGSGNLVISEQTASLVVRQTHDHHDRLREVLDGMRRTSDVQVMAQIKVIRVPAADLVRPDDQLLKPRTLSDTEQSAWDLGKHRWSEAPILEWANVTLPDGHEFQMKGESFKSSLTYRATVSEDRRSVMVEVNDSDNDHSTTLSIPDGKLTMMPICKGRIPVLEDGQALVVVIAPTIKVLKEEEELLGALPRR
jgi:hypothetical protein